MSKIYNKEPTLFTQDYSPIITSNQVNKNPKTPISELSGILISNGEQYLAEQRDNENNSKSIILKSLCAELKNYTGSLSSEQQYLIAKNVFDSLKSQNPKVKIDVYDALVGIVRKRPNVETLSLYLNSKIESYQPQTSNEQSKKIEDQGQTKTNEKKPLSERSPILRTINNLRKRVNPILAGVGAMGASAGLMLNNSFNQPEMSNKTVVSNESQVVRSVEKTNPKAESKKLQVEITNEPVKTPSKMVISNITQSKLEGTVSNSSKFNPKTLVSLLKSYGLDSENNLQKLINKNGVQNLIDSGIIVLKLEKDISGKDRVKYSVNLDSTDLKFSQLKTTEIKTAQNTLRDKNQSKTIV